MMLTTQVRQALSAFYRKGNSVDESSRCHVCHHPSDDGIYVARFIDWDNSHPIDEKQVYRICDTCAGKARVMRAYIKVTSCDACYHTVPCDYGASVIDPETGPMWQCADCL